MDSSARQFGKIEREIETKDITDLLKKLIEIPSHRLIPGKEGKIAEFIANWFDSAGIEVKVKGVTPGRANVIATIRGSGDGHSLMYNCHMDTVPEYGWTGEPGPFQPQIKDGKVYGRGACDMKGAIAAIMVAMRAMQRTETELSGDLIFAGVVGEEGDGSIGTKEIVNEECLPDMAVVCEPTDLNVSIGQRGSSNLLLTVHGVPAHSAYPERGVNAINLMSDVLQALEKQICQRLARRRHRLLGPPTLTPTVINGGLRTDVVPDFCEVKLNYRYVPGQEPDQLEREIRDLLKTIKEKKPELRAEVSVVSDALGMETQKNHPLVRALRHSVKAISKRYPRIVSSGFWTDASILSNQGHVSTVIFGPGEEFVAHTTKEYVESNQLLVAAKSYALTAGAICQQKCVESRS